MSPKSNNVLLRVFEMAYDGMMVIGHNGKIIFINESAKRMLDLNETKASQYSDIMLNNMNDENDHFHQIILDAIANPNSLTRENAEFIHKDGKRNYLSVVCTYLRPTNQLEEEGIIINLHDITEIINTQQQLQQANVEIKQAKDKAEAASAIKTTFIQNITHEIRTPLNAISGFTQAITSGAVDDDPDTKKQLSNEIMRNTDNLTAMLNDIIAIANYDAYEGEVQPTEVNSKEFLLDLAYNCARPLKPGVSMIADIDNLSDDDTLYIDRDLTGKALAHVVDNAIKFTDNGEIHVGITRTAESFTIYVEDTGIGIAEGQEEAIFERFRKVNDFIPGAGLGLSICRAIANVLDATIKVDTTYKKGSRFVFKKQL